MRKGRKVTSKPLPRMISCIRTAFLLLFFHPASTTPALVSKAVKLGQSLTLQAAVSQVDHHTSLWLYWAGERIAIWSPREAVNDIHPKYAQRISFSEVEFQFQISNMSLADGGIYEIFMKTPSSDVSVNLYSVTIFNITTLEVPGGNASCNIDLLCEAGMGPSRDRVVAYSWKDRGTGLAVAQGPLLQQTVSLKDDRAYICIARLHSTEGLMDVVLREPCLWNTAAEAPQQLGPLVLGLASLLLLSVTAAMPLL